MAKKKTTEPQDPNVEVVEAPAVDAETPEVEAPEVTEAEAPEAPEAVETAPVEKTKALKEEKVEMSDAVKGVLKTFADHKELWISKFGGVYTSKPSSSVGAILYKNPYFKS